MSEIELIVGLLLSAVKCQDFEMANRENDKRHYIHTASSVDSITDCNGCSFIWKECYTNLKLVPLQWG